MIDETLPWLVFPPALDLSNTILITPRGEVDLLATDSQLEAWVDAERGRIPAVDAAVGRSHEVRALRADVRALLYAYAGGDRPPEGSRRRINALSAAAPSYPGLTFDGEIVLEHASNDGFAIFASEVARSAIELVGDGDRRISVCGAPSCGMLFLPDDPRQRWCSPACGNRARVARHAARRRRTKPVRT